jgi:ABC-type siderophore export system fused ATPase/permease subunit
VKDIFSLRLCSALAIACLCGAAESVFLLSLVAAVSGLHEIVGIPIFFHAAGLDPMVAAWTLLLLVVALRIGVSREISSSSEDVRRRLEARLADLSMTCSLRRLETRGPGLIESAFADIDRIFAFIENLRALFASAIGCLALVACLVWLSPLASCGLAASLVVFGLTLRARFRTVARRDRRRAAARTTFVSVLSQALAAAAEIRLAGRSAALIRSRFDQSRRCDKEQGAREETLLACVEAAAFASLSIFALFFVWIVRVERIGVDTAAAYVMTLLLLVPAMTTLSAYVAQWATFGQAVGRLRDLTIGFASDASAAGPHAGRAEDLYALEFRSFEPACDGPLRGAPLDFELGRGEVVYLVGPNGSGKTTALKSIAGLYPDGGGDAFSRDANGGRRRVGASERRLLFSACFAESRLPAPDRCDEALLGALTAVDLTPRSGPGDDLDLSDLSWGERKRFDLASALADDRPFVLLDEATANQSPEFKARFFSRIVPALLANNKGVIVATHDVAFLGPEARILQLGGGDWDERIKAGAALDIGRDDVGPGDGQSPRRRRLHRA